MHPQKIALLTDSCADLTPEVLEENHIFTVPAQFSVPMENMPTVADIRAADIPAPPGQGTPRPPARRPGRSGRGPAADSRGGI